MIGDEHLDECIVVQFRAPLWELVGEHRYVIYSLTDPPARTSLLPAGRDDRWLCGIGWDPAREQLSDYTDDRVRAMIATATGVPGLAPRIERTNAFSFAAQIAEHFRHGDVFLVGDAAHRISPRGATGMNTAVADAFDIGWKLAWVLKGWARPALLASYEQERRPLVEHNLVRSADPMGSLRPVISELSVDLAGRIAHRWVATPAGPISTLDLVGDGATLLVGPRSTTWDRVIADIHAPLPVSVGRLDVVTARALGIAPDGALLLRPDGFPVASWNTPDNATRNMHEALATAGDRNAYRVRTEASRWVNSHSPNASLVSGRAK